MPPANRNNPTARRLSRDSYTLTIRQGPEVGRAMNGSGKEKDRKPIDPPPIVQLQIRDFGDPAQNWLQSPYYSCIVSLWDKAEDEAASEPTLHGSLVSSLHRLKDMHSDADGGFFVFPDLSVKVEGEYRLKFVLWELLDGEMESLQSIISTPFKVHTPKLFPGLAESTYLTRAFSDQGVRLRIRKETRTALKRSAAEAESAYASHVDPPGMTSPYASSQAYSYGTEYNSVVKRQKPTGNDAWPYSQPQQSPGGYAHPHASQVPAYYPEAVSGAPQMDYNFRSAGSADTSMNTQYAYQRPTMGDYSQASQALPYHAHPRASQGSVHTGVTGYSDAGSYESSTVSPLGARGGTDAGQSQPYRYNVPGEHSVLPPISTAGPAASNTGMTSPSGYPNYATTDSRYGNISQQAGRSAYGQGKGF